MSDVKRDATVGKPPPRFLSREEALKQIDDVRVLVGMLLDALSDESLTPEMQRAKVLALKAILNG